MSGVTAWASWTAGGVSVNAAPREPLTGKLGAWPEAPPLSQVHPRARRPHPHSKWLVQLAAPLLSGKRFERLGVAVGTSAGCAQPDRAFEAELQKKGTPFGSPSLFVYTLPTAPLGELSVAFAATGPLLSLDSGGCSGLHSVGVAAREIDLGRADAMICGAMELGVADEFLALFLIERGGRALAGFECGFGEGGAARGAGALGLARALAVPGAQRLAQADPLGFWAEVTLR